MSIAEDVINRHILDAVNKAKRHENDQSVSGRRSWNYALYLHDELLKLRAEIGSITKAVAK